MDGWIKLHRKFLEWQWYDSPVVKSVFLHLLLTANVSDNKWHGIDVKRGQVITSLEKISIATGHTVQEVRTAIKKLKSTQCVTQSKTSKFSVFTVINYDNYQSATECLTGNQQAANRQATGKQQATNNTIRKKEYKKERMQEYTPPTPSKGAGGAKKQTEKPKPEKVQFAEFVSMTNDEYTSLVTKVGEQGAKRCVEILDNYKGSSGKKYVSDYRAMLNWVLARYREEQAKQLNNSDTKEENTHSYDLDLLVQHAMEHTPKIKQGGK